jgi:hypothetical protein
MAHQSAAWTASASRYSLRLSAGIHANGMPVQARRAVMMSATMQTRIISSAAVPSGAFSRALRMVSKFDGYRVWSGEHVVASDSLRPPIRGRSKKSATHPTK